MSPSTDGFSYILSAKRVMASLRRQLFWDSRLLRAANYLDRTARLHVAANHVWIGPKQPPCLQCSAFTDAITILRNCSACAPQPRVLAQQARGEHAIS